MAFEPVIIARAQALQSRTTARGTSETSADCWSKLAIGALLPPRTALSETYACAKSSAQAKYQGCLPLETDSVLSHPNKSLSLKYKCEGWRRTEAGVYSRADHPAINFQVVGRSRDDVPTVVLGGKPSSRLAVESAQITNTGSVESMWRAAQIFEAKRVE
jgi:hypothetical protein